MINILNKAPILIRKIKYFVNRRNMSASSGIFLKDVVNNLEAFAPLNVSEKWDNTGVLLEPYTPRQINKILLTNDLTEDVMEEAVKIGVEMIISYHPPIFASLKRITQSTWKERIASMCLEYGIAVYSPHTSWDNVQNGVNDWLAGCLPLHTKQFIIPGLVPDTGSGRLCTLTALTPLKNIVEALKSHIGVDHVQLALARTHDTSSHIGTVALCAGSGSSVLRGVRADLFLTGEMGHHEVLDAVHCGSSVVLTNHSNSERGFLREFAVKLEKTIARNVRVFVSERDRDPLNTV